MSSNDWLSIREAMDFRFRSLPLARKFMKSAVERHLIVDLGCGTGTNCRYLCRLWDVEVRWLCIDHDDRALQTATKRLPARLVRFKKADLAIDLDSIPFRDNISITASAFLDLTSQDWLQRFAARCERMPLLFSMTTSGGPIWEPNNDFDEAIGRCLEIHRTSDHGFGPAAGSNASKILASDLVSRGCDVSCEASNWHLGNQDREAIEVLVGGIGRRALETLPREQVEKWMKLRRDQNRAGCLRLTIPHVDLLSLPC
ncbi:class I SAM-dependent methyltransferase [Rubripirellula amarantea]|nr:class I SAM-dependent methyltransferase [Rubripirellula amarantea]